MSTFSEDRKGASSHLRGADGLFLYVVGRGRGEEREQTNRSKRNECNVECFVRRWAYLAAIDAGGLSTSVCVRIHIRVYARDSVSSGGQSITPSPDVSE